jgi:hypothetical protein
MRETLISFGTLEIQENNRTSWRDVSDILLMEFLIASPNRLSLYVLVPVVLAIPVFVLPFCVLVLILPFLAVFWLFVMLIFPFHAVLWLFPVPLKL